jgi:hypothetical protein
MSAHRFGLVENISGELYWIGDAENAIEAAALADAEHGVDLATRTYLAVAVLFEGEAGYHAYDLPSDWTVGRLEVATPLIQAFPRTALVKIRERNG